MRAVVRLHAPPIAVHPVEAELMELAEADAMAREQAAYERGLVEGQHRSDESFLANLSSAIDSLEAVRQCAEEALPRDAVELACEIAAQLLKLRVEDGAYDIEKIVRGALAGGGIERGRCLVHLSPRDHERLADVQFRSDTELVADPELAPAEVHIQTPSGLLVRELDEALEEIREQLLEDLA